MLALHNLSNLHNFFHLSSLLTLVDILQNPVGVCDQVFDHIIFKCTVEMKVLRMSSAVVKQNKCLSRESRLASVCYSKESGSVVAITEPRNPWGIPSWRPNRDNVSHLRSISSLLLMYFKISIPCK